MEAAATRSPDAKTTFGETGMPTAPLAFASVSSASPSLAVVGAGVGASPFVAGEEEESEACGGRVLSVVEDVTLTAVTAAL